VRRNAWPGPDKSTLAAGTATACGDVGGLVLGNEWQAKWDKLDADDAQAKATNEATERTRTPEMGGQSFGWIRTTWGRCKDFMGARRSEITVGIYNAKLLIFIG